jgi:hypothetical protein
LLKDLQSLHQRNLEQNRLFEQAQIQHAAELVALQKSLGLSASRPIIVPSRSPFRNAQATTATPEHPEHPSPNDTPHVPTPHLPPAHGQLDRPQAPQPPAAHHRAPKVTWLTDVQNVSRAAAQVIADSQRHEQRRYDAHQRLLAEDAQDQAIIKAATLRSLQRRKLLDQHGQGAPTDRLSTSTAVPHIAPKRRSKPTRQDELRLAALTNDRDLLRGGSDRVESEERSTDDEAHILRETTASAAAAHLFSKARPSARSLRDKNGYIPNDFVVADDTDETHSSKSVDSGSPHDSSPEGDGDPSSDYKPSSQSDSPPSPARPNAFSDSQWREYQALKRAHQQANSHKPQDNLVPHTPRYNISIADPPEHGDWRDIHHLMTVFKDKHVKYVKRCGEGRSLSVWECYTETAQECIVKQLQATNSGSARDAAYLASLTNSELYDLLQDELGISYDMEVEQALTSIPFSGSILDKSNWVVFHTAWSQVLKRVTQSGKLQPRRMADIFRDRIPDDFMQTWLKSRKHPTWEAAYEAAVTALSDPKWHTCYAKHIIAKAAKTDPSKTLPKPTQPAPQTALAPQGKPTPTAAHHPTTLVQTKLDFPTAKNKNVNPNYKPDLNENPLKTPCDRCGSDHKWLSALCTNDRHLTDKGKKVPPLTPDEFKSRIKQRWDKGFWFGKPIDAFQSPTVATVAEAAASASVKLHGGK